MALVAQEVQQQITLIQWAVSIAVPAVAGLVGVLIGAWLTGCRERSHRCLAFLERQLRDFYSPMLGLRNEIQMRGELRVQIQTAADAAWRGLAKETRRNGVRAPEQFSAEREPEFKKLIEYDNTQLERELLPAYRRMVSLFRDNYWLADLDTRGFYQQLVQFVELWERWLADAIPWEVIERLGHSEENLQAFYAHLEEKHDSLRGRIENGKP
ncbi:MAG: hypothetical protein WC971_08145 [Coriobacteriia bacterium]